MFLQLEHMFRSQFIYEIVTRAIKREEDIGQKPHHLLLQCLDYIHDFSLGKQDESTLKELMLIFQQEECKYTHPDLKDIRRSLRSQYTFLVIELAMKDLCTMYSQVREMACYQAADIGQETSWVKRMIFKIDNLVNRPFTMGFYQIAPSDKKSHQSGRKELQWQNQRIEFWHAYSQKSRISLLQVLSLRQHSVKNKYITTRSALELALFSNE